MYYYSHDSSHLHCCPNVNENGDPCLHSYTAFTLHNYGTARVRHGPFGPHLHCDNQRRAHGVMNRHVSSRAYSRLFGGCYATVMALYSCSSRLLSLSSSSQSSLKKRRQRMRLRSLRFKQRQSRKKALEVYMLVACTTFKKNLDFFIAPQLH